MNRILCSTGALIGWPNGRDFTLLKRCSELLECDGFEFLMYGNWHENEDALKRFVLGLSLNIPVFHIEKDVGNLISRNAEGDVEKAFSLFESNCALAKEFGAKKLVLHLWGGLDSDKNFANNAECYKQLLGTSDSFGLSLTVENVVCNNKDPMSRLIELAKLYPDIAFTFDTKMAEFHNQTSLLYLPENQWLFPNISHFHINDYAGGYMEWNALKTLHIGQGHVDFLRLFEFLKSKGYKGDFTVEATSFDQSGVIDHSSLNKSFAAIREYLNK